MFLNILRIKSRNANPAYLQMLNWYIFLLGGIMEFRGRFVLLNHHQIQNVEFTSGGEGISTPGHSLNSSLPPKNALNTNKFLTTFATELKTENWRDCYFWWSENGNWTLISFITGTESKKNFSTRIDSIFFSVPELNWNYLSVPELNS